MDGLRLSPTNSSPTFWDALTKAVEGEAAISKEIVDF